MTVKKARVPPMRLMARDVAAYLLDRADQYDDTSGCWVALSDAARNVMRGEVGEAVRHGDFDHALYARVDGFAPILAPVAPKKSRPPKASPRARRGGKKEKLGGRKG